MEIEYRYVDDNFKIKIDNVINEMFPKLNISHKQIIKKYLIDIVEIIHLKFNFNVNNRAIYDNQFIQNNSRDLKGIILMLLPFINDKIDSIKNITSFNDIYTKKVKNVDINKKEPEYVYSNIEYGRCMRGDNIVEVPFKEEYIRQNYILLKDTIQIVANKLYVNWINVRPISSEDYDQTYLYKETEYLIKTHQLNYWDPTSTKIDTMTYGLYVGDIYDALTNYLFYNILKIKWCIYDNKVNGKMLPYVVILNDIFSLEKSLNGWTWEDLNNEEKESFRNNWKNFISLKSDKYDNSTLKQIIRKLMIYFQLNYTRIEELIKKNEYKPFEIKENDEEDDVEDKDADINDMENSLKVDPKYIYDYISDCLSFLKRTWYANHFIYKENGFYKIYNVSSDEYLIEYGDTIITFKNIYNFSKSLCHYTKDKKYMSYPRYWRSLKKEDKDEILRRLNWDTNEDEDVQEWFSVTKYLRKIRGLSNTEAIKENLDIFIYIKNELADIVFDILTKQGVLSQFTPEPSITDELQLPKIDKKIEIQKRLKKLLFENPKYTNVLNDSVYFLTNEKYKDLKISYEKDNQAIEQNYIDFIMDNIDGAANWVTNYAMDWISQIAFFHKYLHNRIIYVTGATGVGKSTQTPKLLLYAMKMIDYKMDGNIVCTQPRTAPTEGNATYIGLQMGVPLEQYNKSIDKNITSDNYYVQFQYQKKKHARRTEDQTLKIVTDGILYQELKNNPLLKKKVNDNFKMTNKYDIVIIDEAHEHNKNMDLILTMIKYSLYYNNSLRLVIISATMDQDEPIYRRFYRDINDNRMYPFTTLLEDHKLDCINVDRRLHISPPGETTKYEIKDIYLGDNINVDDKVLEIIKTNTTGDVLLFQPGQREIDNSIEYLNKKLPNDTIALPFYASMTSKKKEFIQNLNNEKKKKIRIAKNINFGKNYIEDEIEKVPKGTYKRVVIVGTNIAEASITIKTLRFVVDTGIEKVMEYDYKTRTSKLKSKKISEQSRLQRRGRVGRVAEGTVYYAYNKGDMENNKKPYDIAISDINLVFMDLLKNKFDEMYLIDPKNDINNPNFQDNIKYNNLATLYNNGINKIVKNQYFIEEEFIKYIGDPEQYDYNNMVPPHNYFQTGYSYKTITDEDGSYYIIHPDELKIKRNIIGVVMDKDEKDGIKVGNNKILSDKVKSFWDILKERAFIYDTFNSKNQKISVNKTEFGIKTLMLKEKLQIENIEDVIGYIYSRIFGCDKEYYALISLLNLLKFSGNISMVFNMINVEGKEYYNIEKGKILYGNNYGDCHALVNIIIKVLKFINKRIINLNKIFSKNLSREQINKIKDEKVKFLDALKNNNFNKINKDYIDKFVELKTKGLINNSSNIEKDEINDFLKNNILVNEINDNFEKNKNIFIRWCEKENLNPKTFELFINNYVDSLNLLYKFKKGIEDIDYDLKIESLELNWFDKHLKSINNSNNIEKKNELPNTGFNKNEGLTKSLLHGYGYNIVKKAGVENIKIKIKNETKIKEESSYIKINDPTFDNRVVINKIGRNINSLVKNNNFSEYLLYIAERYGISIITNVNPRLIQKNVPFIYAPFKYSFKNYEQRLYKKADTRIMERIKKDMMDNYDDNVYNDLNNLDESKRYKEYINMIKK